MRILHVVPSYKPAFIYGGPIESVSKLCEGLANHGHHVDVFTTTANGKEELVVPVGIPVVVEGVNVTYFKRITKDPTHISPDLWMHLKSTVKTYDIVHIQSWWNLLVLGAGWICYRQKVKVVISPRGMLSKYIFNSGQSFIKKALHKVMGRRLLSKFWFHATAKAEFEECREIIPGWKGFIEPNILTLPETDTFCPENDVFTIVFMSRIHPKKGIEILLKAISLLEFPVMLRIAGSGETGYIKSLKTLAKELNLDKNIQWLGWLDREDKFQALGNADLFVLVSFNENFANVVVEALHMGTPILVSKGVALSEFVEQNDLGWVTGLSAYEISSKLSIARADSDKRMKIRKTGRSVIEDQFNPNKLIKNYLNHYYECMSSQ